MEGCPSEIFLKYAVKLAKSKNFEIGNLDCTIICEKSKIKPYAELIKINIQNIINLKKDRISVKATTTERLGFTGARNCCFSHSNSYQPMSAAIATIFGIGYLRPAPGTWGSLFALVLAILLLESFGIIGFAIALLSTSVFGWWATSEYLKRTANKDPPRLL